ncbi:hypothetical protein PMI14_05842 [Acidovorax sp. CF316]|uniref:hypothetical protein n=1 Tax=Acidovorax sp. CF316 TaxID=1144317 RepID=UPI00026BC802|nr:hypothetical protein [Acidovorax sp. CF316]EJE49599.1 hypothetical protein PMI14_05842 [Acidovorax sp. CF316]
MSTHNTIVIGLTGPLNCGKDTVGQLLAQHCGAHVMAFADPLREEIAEAYCIEQVFLTRRDTKERPMAALAFARCLDRAFVDRMVVEFHNGADGTLRDFLEAPRSPRQIMRWWGTEYRRANSAGYWVHRAAQRVSWLHKGRHARLVVITDVRFADEAELVHGIGGQVWQITRPGCAAQTGQHQSEVTGEAFSPTAVIDNAGDIRHLQQQVLSAWAAREWQIPGVRVEVPAQ